MIHYFKAGRKVIVWDYEKVVTRNQDQSKKLWWISPSEDSKFQEIRIFDSDQTGKKLSKFVNFVVSRQLFALCCGSHEHKFCIVGVRQWSVWFCTLHEKLLGEILYSLAPPLGTLFLCNPQLQAMKSSDEKGSIFMMLSICWMYVYDSSICFSFYSPLEFFWSFCSHCRWLN